jgi:hypothetical protein
MSLKKVSFGENIKNKKCGICKSDYTNSGRHSGWPITNPNGIVCDNCHATKVIPLRLKNIK